MLNGHDFTTFLEPFKSYYNEISVTKANNLHFNKTSPYVMVGKKMALINSYVYYISPNDALQQKTSNAGPEPKHDDITLIVDIAIGVMALLTFLLISYMIIKDRKAKTLKTQKKIEDAARST